MLFIFRYKSISGSPHFADVVLEQEEAVRHDIGRNEGAGEDRKTEGTGVGGGAGGFGVADEDGGEGGENGGTDFGGEGDGGECGEDVNVGGGEVTGA